MYLSVGLQWVVYESILQLVPRMIPPRASSPNVCICERGMGVDTTDVSLDSQTDPITGTLTVY